MPEINAESGFYFNSNGRLIFASGDVYGPGWNIVRNEYESYTYPYYGWRWAFTREEARVAFGLPDLETLKQDFLTAINNLLDSIAQQKGFDSILSAVSYMASPNRRFNQQSHALFDWRDRVWEEYFRIIHDLDSGNKEFTSVQEMLQLLPPIQWPPEWE